MAAVLARFGLRTLNLLLLFFAALGFCFVPLGERTAWDHTRAILATQEAKAAYAEFEVALDRLKSRLMAAWDQQGISAPQVHIAPVASPYAVPMQVGGLSPRGERAK